MDAPPRETPLWHRPALQKWSTLRGAVVGQNKGNTLESFQFMKAKVELYDNTKQ